MTTVTRPVRRETLARQYSKGKNRPVLIILEPPGTLIRLRLKGERKSVAIRVADVYTMACRAEALAKKAARKAAREARRKSH